MALFDDKWWLLSHIGHSFVLSDDTGNSEIVITARDAKDVRESIRTIAVKEGTKAFLESLHPVDEADDFQPHSFEIRLGRRKLGYHRPRCNTELKLEKMRREKRNVPKIRTITWKEKPNAQLTETDLDRLFPPAGTQERPKSGFASRLAKDLNNTSPTDKNPFEAFSKFDGNAVSAKEKIRTLQVFLDMVSADEKRYPLKLQVLGNAKVHEVIGYICWRYTREKRQPQLNPSVHKYTLYIADADGTIEREFPPLERQEPLSKYGFNTVGMVDVSKDDFDKKNGDSNDRRIVVYLPDGTFTDLELDTCDITLGDIMEKVLSKRRATSRFRYNHQIEKKSDPRNALDKGDMLSSYETREFCIIRENSRRIDESADTSDVALKSQISQSELEAPVYREYHNVYAINKVRAKVEVVFGISECKLEIYPKQSSSKFWKRQKSSSYDMDQIIACDITDRKQNGRWVFRLVFSSDQGYKQNHFECDESVAVEIHSKICHLIDWQTNEKRAEYLASKEKKVQRRRSWHFK